MTTLVIHGTNRIDGLSCYPWWREGPFVEALRTGLIHAGGIDDIWSVGGLSVGAVEWPRRSGTFAPPKKTSGPLGIFEWSGTHMSLDRHAGAGELAHYLSALARLSPEPIRIAAYSHGCNVVKAASVHPRLDPAVRISRAVFLGCPHIYADTVSGRLCAYRLDPARFGRILNLSLPGDITQTGLPNTIMGPPTARWMAWVPPQAAASDPDPDTAAVYENAVLSISDEVAPEDRHAHLHGTTAAALAGRWLAGTATVEESFPDNGGSLPVIPPGDTGCLGRDHDYRIMRK